jgi:tetratricopeptide (TPR) repeat protein
MKKTGWLILAVLAVSWNVFAQINPDSLMQKTAPGNPYKVRIEAYVKYIEFYRLKNFDSTLLIAGEALTLALNNHDTLNAAIIKKNTGVAHYFKGNYPAAAAHFYEAVALLEKFIRKAPAYLKELAYTYNEIFSAKPAPAA